jgi:glycosyltransferase involved in cell wall biosynthesis
MKRICMVTHSFYESDNRILRYAETLAARGDEVHVIALRRSVDLPQQEMINAVQLHRIQDRFGKRESSAWSFLRPLLRFTWASSRWLAANGRSRPFDVIHVHNIPDFLVFSTWSAKLRGSRVILDIHDIVPEFFGSKFGQGPNSLVVRTLRLIERLSAAMADRVILSNHLWLDRYASRSAPAAKCVALINHVDERVFRAVPRKGTPRAPTVVFPGGLQWHQGLDIAIRAFVPLLKRLPSARFEIYGEGGAKPALKVLVDELGLQQAVHFHEPMRLREIAQVMADADLGVVPKRADSFGNEAYSTKIMEFMSVGVPIVVSSTKVDRYYFDEDVVRFFPSGDVEALADAMYELLTDTSRREAQIRRAHEYVLRNSWSRHKHIYLDLIDGLSGVGVSAAKPTSQQRAPDR